MASRRTAFAVKLADRFAASTPPTPEF